MKKEVEGEEKPMKLAEAVRCCCGDQKAVRGQHAAGTNRLQCLRLACCYQISDKGLCDVAKKLSQLEELDMSTSNFTKDSLEAIGRCCPLLKSLKFNMQCYGRSYVECDEEAFAIAKTMPGLRHLQLFGNNLTNDGLLAILDGCPHLESLDLRQCFHVKLGGSLSKRCAEQIKDLRIPYNLTEEYPFEAEIDYGSLDEDYPYRLSDLDFLSYDHYDHYEFSGGSDSSECDYDN
ncbi:hypothetical protein ACSQ67_012850 [Phaseolus vulgaris]